MASEKEPPCRTGPARLLTTDAVAGIRAALTNGGDGGSTIIREATRGFIKLKSYSTRSTVAYNCRVSAMNPEYTRSSSTMGLRERAASRKVVLPFSMSRQEERRSIMTPRPACRLNASPGR